ncbi:MAG TPA: RNA-binding protein [Thermoplasmata archaeon]|nr:RNA-binding protein [Thermoplasmata archaeon]
MRLVKIKEIVVPGQLLDEGKIKPGQGAYRDRADGKIYASRLGVPLKRRDFINVIPLTGCYLPKPDELVIGIIVDVAPSYWIVDVNAPYPAVLHVNDVPWKVEFGETSKYLSIADVVLIKISRVSETEQIQVSMRDRNLRKFVGGQVIEIQPTKVPRVIGKKQSMIELVKRYLNVWIFIGKNGRIWLNGEGKSTRLAIKAIRQIEKEAHTEGLTDRIKEWLEMNKSENM